MGREQEMRALLHDLGNTLTMVACMAEYLTDLVPAEGRSLLDMISTDVATAEGKIGRLRELAFDTGSESPRRASDGRAA